MKITRRRRRARVCPARPPAACADEKPFFFSYISVSLCTTYLLHPGLLRCRHPHNLRRLLRPALLLAPSYFCLNYTYFLSLNLTSVSSTMVLSASTGVWTLLFSRLLLHESLTSLRLATVIVSLLGILLVTSAHAAPSSPATAAGVEAYMGYSGDVLALLSAAASGMYMALLRVCVPREGLVHMPSLFGMVGAVCAVGFLPAFPLLHYCGVETFELPPSRTATTSLLLNAATSTVLPDLLLAHAVVMTSPLVATLGLSMMIPLSVLADYVRQLANLTPQFFVGTLAVFIGFQLESWGESWGVSVERLLSGVRRRDYARLQTDKQCE